MSIRRKDPKISSKLITFPLCFFRIVIELTGKVRQNIIIVFRSNSTCILQSRQGCHQRLRSWSIELALGNEPRPIEGAERCCCEQPNRKGQGAGRKRRQQQCPSGLLRSEIVLMRPFSGRLAKPGSVQNRQEIGGIEQAAAGQDQDHPSPDQSPMHPTRDTTC